MSIEPSAPRRSGIYPKIWYLLLTLVAYPLLLVAIRDPLHALSDLRRYLRPAVFAFQYEEQLLAIAFAIVFMGGFAVLFVSTERLRFVILGTIAAALFYPAVLYIATQYYIYSGQQFSDNFSPAGHGYLMLLASCCALITLMRTSPALRVDVLGGPPRSMSMKDTVLFFVMGYSLLLIAYLYPLFVILLEVFPDVSQVGYSRLAELLDVSPFSGFAQLAVLIGAAIVSGIFSILIINVARSVFWITVVPATAIFYNLLVYSYDLFIPKLCRSPEVSLCISYLEMGFLFALSVFLSLLLFKQAVRYFRGVHPSRYF